MADYMAAEIQIGGNLPKERLEEFVEKILSSDAGPDYDAGWDRESLLDQIHAGRQSLALYDFEARYGEFPDLEQFCKGVGLSFVRHSDAKYEFDSVLSWFTPATEGSTYATQDGRPLVLLDKVYDLLDMDRQEMLTRLEEMEPPEIPPLRIK